MLGKFFRHRYMIWEVIDTHVTSFGPYKWDKEENMLEIKTVKRINNKNEIKELLCGGHYDFVKEEDLHKSFNVVDAVEECLNESPLSKLEVE